jgi:hypothetical protein
LRERDRCRPLSPVSAKASLENPLLLA